MAENYKSVKYSLISNFEREKKGDMLEKLLLYRIWKYLFYNSCLLKQTNNRYYFTLTQFLLYKKTLYIYIRIH